MQAMDNEQMKNWITAAETLKRAQEKFLGYCNRKFKLRLIMLLELELTKFVDIAN